MIQAGKAAQIKWGSGDWIFLDIGFASKARSCGFLVGDGNPRCVTFAEASAQIKDACTRSRALNLVIEAPLSVCFDCLGNPTGRSIEVEGLQARYWYTGPGCAVMVASMYLLRDLDSKASNASVRLFEGFVSYKSEKPSDHRQDVLALRNVVRDPHRFHTSIYSADRLKRNEADVLCGAFRVLGLDCGIPAVIKPTKDLLDSN